MTQDGLWPESDHQNHDSDVWFLPFRLPRTLVQAP